LRQEDKLGGNANYKWRKQYEGGAAAMRDLFAAPINGKHYLKPVDDPFRYICGVFSGDGAIQILQRANKIPLATYFPIRFNGKGEPVPLWRAYLLIEFREGVTINLCRTTSNFIKIVGERDEEGLVHPVLVKREAVKESMAMVLEGRYNERIIERRFYGSGSIVAVLHGIMATRKVRLEQNVTPDMPGRQRVMIDMDGIKGTIEIHKLAL
jgi:hypothetical protein